MKETLKKKILEEPVMNENIETLMDKVWPDFSPMQATHVEKKDIIQRIARREAKSIWETSRRKKWSLIHLK